MDLFTKIRTRQLFLVFISVFSFHSLAIAYAPPIGIPAPPFGIDESHRIYTGEIYDAGGFSYRDAGNGPYTHYIDASSANCTNTANPYGTAEQPRCSLPTDPDTSRRLTLPAGSVVEIHGGLDTPYDRGGIYQILFEGNVEKPIFFRGYSNSEDEYPQFTNTDFRIAGSYAVIEHLDIYDDSAFGLRPSFDFSGNNRSNHIVLRSMHIHEPIGDSGDYSGTSGTGDYLVYYNNHIHHNWRSEQQDAHGIYIGENSHNIWILENHIYNNSGNGFQTCHRCLTNPPENIYIGKNIMHSDKELAIGMKYANHVIISQNTIYDYTDSTTAQGTGIVIGADGPTNNVWLLFNKISNAPYGIRIEETETDVYILGNIISDIEHAAINLEKRGPNVYLNNNTISNVGQFINQSWRDQFILHARNNLFINASQAAGVLIESSVVANPSVMENNLFFESEGSTGIYWASSRETYTSTEELTSFIGGSNNLFANPDFLHTTLGEYQLSENSPATEAGAKDTESIEVYNIFKDRYGLDIQVDYAGNRRPHGTNWDIGAYEFGGVSPLAPPSPPMLLSSQ